MFHWILRIVRQQDLYFLPTADLGRLPFSTPNHGGLLRGRLPHRKDEALAMDIPYVQRLPIPLPTETQFETARVVFS